MIAMFCGEDGGNDTSSYGNACEKGSRRCIENDVAECLDGSWAFAESCGESVCAEGRCRSLDYDTDPEEDQETPETQLEDDSELQDCDEDYFGESDSHESIESDAELEREQSDEGGMEEDFDCLDDMFAGSNASESTAYEISLPADFFDLRLCPWAEQWFVFSVQESWGVRAILTYAPENGVLDLKLYKEGHNGLYDFVAFTPEHLAQSELVYNQAEAGVYFLRVHGRELAQTFDLSVEGDPNGFGIGNDLCQGAESIELNDTISASTAEAHNDDSYSCSESMGPDVVYQFQLPSLTSIRIALEADFDGVFAVRRDCLDESSELRCMDEAGSGVAEILELTDLSAGLYYIFVDGRKWSDSGEFTLSVEEL